MSDKYDNYDSALERDMLNGIDNNLFTISPSGATRTCNYCGSHYYNWEVDVCDYVPSVGDGCKYCVPNLIPTIGELKYDEAMGD